MNLIWVGKFILIDSPSATATITTLIKNKFMEFLAVSIFKYNHLILFFHHFAVCHRCVDKWLWNRMIRWHRKHQVYRQRLSKTLTIYRQHFHRNVIEPISNWTIWIRRRRLVRNLWLPNCPSNRQPLQQRQQQPPSHQPPPPTIFLVKTITIRSSIIIG